MGKWDIPEEPIKTGITALIDGDVVVYRIGFSVQKDVFTVEYQGEIYTFEGKKALNEWLYQEKLPPDSEDVIITQIVVVEPEQNAYHSIKLLIEDILDQTQADSYEIYLTGSNNFRSNIARTVPYKGNRTGRKPELYDAIRNYMVKYHGARVVEGFEADDAMSIAQSKRDKTVICSIDKDLLMVPGLHYNWVKENLESINEVEGYRNFWKQMASGDTVDNIIGLPKIGEVKAAKLVQEENTFFSMFRKVWDKYKEAFGAEAADRFVENIYLLWMVRDESEIPIKT